MSDSAARLDVLQWPGVRSLVRWRHGRLALQVPLLMAAVIVVAHGLLGPQIAPRNLATVSVWIHYRGFLVLALLAAGNLFCTGCPMILVRDAGRRLFHPALRWPRALRNKWPAIGLLVAVLFSYELFGLWDLPRATAWLIVGYFAAALLVDTIFSGATFCKYVCPIGQFNFVASTMSPLELQVRDTATCRTCRTADCIKGSHQRGCELGLFMPVKVGNLDCTLCMDCVRACPQDNIALVPRLPGDELADARRRSGIGRLPLRRDIAALAVVFALGAMLNAFAMTRPAAAVEQWLAGATHLRSQAIVLGFIFATVLVVIPAVFVSFRAGVRYAYALIPFGLGAWVAHYAFHLLTGILTIVPVTQSAIIDAVGSPLLGEPLWRWAGMRPGAVFPIQLGFLLLGAAGSLGVAAQISEREQPGRPFRTAAPWWIVILALAGMAIWILAQPMDMRGVSFGG